MQLHYVTYTVLAWKFIENDFLKIYWRRLLFNAMNI